MAEMKFNCPKCGQLIACDELWGGHQIQCPTCQTEIAVPAQGTAPPQATPAASTGGLVPDVPKSAPRLSIGQARHHASSTAPQTLPTSTLARTAASLSPPKQKSSAMKPVVYGLVVIALAVGGYFGFTWIKERQDKANAKSKEASQNSDGGNVGHIANLYDVLDATEPGGRMMGGGGGGSSRPRRRPPGPNGLPVAPSQSFTDAAGKPMPVIAPMWTLDTNAAKIPESRVNGLIGGTNFVADSAHFDPVAGKLVLRFLQGALTAPDRQVLIYLSLKAGDKLAGHGWSVSPDMKGVPQVMKVWKPDPRLPQKNQTFSTGYAMSLQLGKIEDGGLSGKIFLALPDPEQSVIAGVFEAETKLPDTVAPVGTAPAGTPAVQKRPPGTP